MYFSNYKDEDYNAVTEFLLVLVNEGKEHINWNWARFEWMMEHPDMDRSSFGTIGLWWDERRVIGAAIYDMYFGEAFCGVLSNYRSILPEVMEYACSNLKDEDGLAIAIMDDDEDSADVAERLGFIKCDQRENVMRYELDHIFSAKLPVGLTVTEFDPAENACEFAWLLWQGFDHGSDRGQFEAEDEKRRQVRRNLNRALSLAAVDNSNRMVGYVCLWYKSNTDYAYIEPVCTIPEYRGRGIAKALLSEAFTRARLIGARQAFVISDMEFYKKLGFTDYAGFTFYRKK